MNQQSVNLELLEVQSLTRRKEITAWLAPASYDVEYYSNDFAVAKALRHPKTCMWVLDKKEVTQLSYENQEPGEAFLCIFASPGAGKTVLSSFLIDHYRSVESRSVLYFFCKNTDADKNTSTAVVRTFLYQLYKSVKDQRLRESLNNDLGIALDRSGQQRAVNFTVLWQLFSTHVRSLGPATIILDALDECQDVNRLIQSLKSLSTLRSIKVIVTSRKEPHLHNDLNNFTSMEIAPEDVDADIAAFVEAKVAASSRLSHPLVRDLVIKKLCNTHNGMFLWVYLTLKELKSCFSTSQVQDALTKLPTGLDGIYKSILQRLQTTLTRSSFDLCSKVLTWVVTAVVGSNLVLSQLYRGLTSSQRPLGVDEIKQALTIQYDMDGDTLLADDRSFPYSDKDVELICGSLVTIRTGTLQVIHLTVKEFLRSRHKTDDPIFFSLLVDPDYASLQLTLVCLRCIAAHAEPLVDLESKVLRIDRALDKDALDRWQARAPLLEYASFSWLVHLIDCKLDDLIKITPTFRKTFNSPRTFSWVEGCMALQPSSTLRLLVGVDEVRDRFYLSENPWPRQDVSSQFLASWCVAMSQVFQEYGAILARRPWEIYFIDLCDIFSADPSLRRLWQEYGETQLRDKDLRFNGYQPARRPQEKPLPHLQLQQSLEVGYSSSDTVFLIHIESQGIYIWGDCQSDGDKLCIFVQHEKTGQRLPPVEHFSDELEQKWQLVNHDISPSGRYLALFYYMASFQSTTASDPRVLTVVWQLRENMSFERRMNCKSWARVVFSHASTEWLWYNSKAVMFKDDRHCYTPWGVVDLLTGSRRSFPDSFLRLVGSVVRAYLSCSGQWLLAFLPSTDDWSDDETIQARRIDPFEPSHFLDFAWEDKRRHLADVSPSGRYLVLGTLRQGLSLFGSGTNNEEKNLSIYDTSSNKTIELALPEPVEYWNAKFHFSRQETRLIAFLFGRTSTNMDVLIWDSLAVAPRLTSHASLCLSSSIGPQQIHVHRAATSAVMVTKARSLQRIELSDEIKFLDTNNLIDDYPHRLSTISRDCSHWVLVTYGQKGGKVQIMDLMSPDAPARHFDLDWSHSDIPRALSQGTDLPIALSPDLHILIINAEVFDITPTEGNDPSERLTRTPFTMEGLPPLLEPHRHQITSWGLECQISPCNSFVLYVNNEDQWGNRSRYSSAILLYHINIETRTSARLKLDLPEELVSLYASFHPSLPLIAVSYASPTVAELEDIQQRPPSLRLGIFDLKSLETTVLEVPKGLQIEAIAE